MSPSPIDIVLMIADLAAIAFLVFLVRKVRQEKRFSLLARLAFGFVLAGFFFGSVPVLGYSLLGAGLILALIDIVRLSRPRGMKGPGPGS